MVRAYSWLPTQGSQLLGLPELNAKGRTWVGFMLGKLSPHYIIALILLPLDPSYREQMLSSDELELVPHGSHWVKILGHSLETIYLWFIYL